MSNVLSPALSASVTDVPQPVPDLIADDGGLDFFNFDEYDSATSSHSPLTASANTPSTLPVIHSPLALAHSPSHAVDEYDLGFDDIFEKGPINDNMIAGPSNHFNIKQEPMDFSFDFADATFPNIPEDAFDFAPQQQYQSQPIPPSAPVIAPAPVASAPNNDLLSFISALPADQQQALQAVMLNIQKYTASYPTPLPAVPQHTIEPSMVFSTSPSTSTSYTAPTSTSASTHISPAALLQPSPAAPAPPVNDDVLVALPANEQPIAGPSRPRQGSTFSSIEDIDSRIDRLAPLQAITSAGRGKGGKKGGGMSSVVRMEDEDLDDDDSWRPSPEEYKKLSSKEKRQLRNKLSARAFRTRRKDYIGTLEGHIQDRDSVIDEIKSELVNFRTENQDLRRELAALKASTMSILHPESAVSTAPSPMISALAMPPSIPTPAAAAGPSVKRAPIQHAPAPVFNPRKDIASSSTEASRGFWGGNDNMLGGGSTICHHLFTPDLVLPKETVAPINLPRVNLNPMLNDPDAPRGPSLAATANGRELNSTFSEWSEANAFSLRSMDSYRMQLWSRLAREATADKEKLSPELRPKFYVEAKSPSTSSTTPSIATAAGSLTPANADILAKVATHHITSKLASSFWAAFASPSSSSSSKFDTDKLTAVVTGTARLRVVANDREQREREPEELNEKAAMANASTSSSPSSAASRNDDADALALAAAMGGLKLQSGLGFGMSSGLGLSGIKMDSMRVRENPLGALSSFFKHASGVPARA